MPNNFLGKFSANLHKRLLKKRRQYFYFSRMVESGLISYCGRQARDGTPKIRRLAEASVSILKLSPQLPKIGNIEIENVIMELYPGYAEQRKGEQRQMPQSVSFLTSTTKNKINEQNLRERQLRLLQVTVSMALGKSEN